MKQDLYEWIDSWSYSIAFPILNYFCATYIELLESYYYNIAFNNVLQIVKQVEIDQMHFSIEYKGHFLEAFITNQWATEIKEMHDNLWHEWNYE